jgi:hypothetical protein
MKFLKKYSQYFDSLQIDLSTDIIDLMESLIIWHDVLLSSIGAEEVDLFKTLSLPNTFENLDLDYLSDNIDFLNSLASLGLKKSPVQNTEDFQTFLNKPCRFMLIYDINSNELQGAEYMLFQTYNETLNKWDNTKMYKMNVSGSNIQQRFFDKLTSRTIEITDGDENYIYTTSNGNDWELQNLKKENDIYKRFFRKEDLQKLLDDRKVKLTIV